MMSGVVSSITLLETSEPCAFKRLVAYQSAFKFTAAMFYCSQGTTKVSDKKIVTREFANFRERLPGILKALAVGIPAGYVFYLLDTPIPWMIGPMMPLQP